MQGLIGYKGTDQNMKCRGMQYKVGKAYHADGTIELCRNGLHFCRNLCDVFGFYNRDGGSRYFEVVASGAIQIGANKCAASDLTITRELSRVEVNRCAYGNGYGYSDGNGDSNGNGYGNGNGDRYGYSYSCGGYSYGGYSYGHDGCCGYGDSYSNGDGNGNGYGCSNNIQKILLFA